MNHNPCLPPSDSLPSARLHPLEFPHAPKTGSSAGDHDLKHTSLWGKFHIQITMTSHVFLPLISSLAHLSLLWCWTLPGRWASLFLDLIVFISPSMARIYLPPWLPQVWEQHFRTPSNSDSRSWVLRGQGTMRGNRFKEFGVPMVKAWLKFHVVLPSSRGALVGLTLKPFL